MDKVAQCTTNMKTWAFKMKPLCRRDISRCKQKLEALKNVEEEEVVVEFKDQKEKLATLLV